MYTIRAVAEWLECAHWKMNLCPDPKQLGFESHSEKILFSFFDFLILVHQL